MTDDNIIRLPGSQADPDAESDRTYEDGDRGRPASDEDEEPNPLLREGPDAPDAADIEDPEEQL